MKGGIFPRGGNICSIIKSKNESGIFASLGTMHTCCFSNLRWNMEYLLEVEMYSRNIRVSVPQLIRDCFTKIRYICAAAGW